MLSLTALEWSDSTIVAAIIGGAAALLAALIAISPATVSALSRWHCRRRATKEKAASSARDALVEKQQTAIMAPPARHEERGLQASIPIELPESDIPQELRSRRLSARSIHEALINAPLFASDEVGELYIGLKVQWPIRVVHLRNSGNRPVLFGMATDTDSSLPIDCTMRSDQTDALISVARHDVVIVRGTIEKCFSYEMRLDGCVIVEA